jgi:hypothetical protein
VFENGMLWRIYGHKRGELTGGWIKLHNDKFHNFQPFPNIIRMIKSKRMRCSEHVACNGAKQSAYKILVGTPEKMRPLGRIRHRWGYISGIENREYGCGDPLC